MFGSQPWQRQYVASANLLRVLRARFLIVLLVCDCGFMLPACRSSQGPANSNSGFADTRIAAFTTPPFSTKEPERYQAVRITSFTETGSTENSHFSQSKHVLIARDGEKRREEYFAGANGQVVYLEIPAGRFIVLTAGRRYADLNTPSDETDPGNPLNDSSALSPDQLLNEAHAPATYEKLGIETLEGRMTTKYRVVVLTGADSQNETLIWVDEGLGMPVRSETTSKSTGHSSKVTMELKDVKLEVDERLFSWPSDYRKVEAGLIFDLIRKDGKGAIPKQDEK
ncbi:MAG: hypothetical protein ACR2IB_01965 [Pyrinomonadaceae bacterium]|jgi:outer membrane lipoprotein-sorting protein